jgi:hypothetical protein
MDGWVFRFCYFRINAGRRRRRGKERRRGFLPTLEGLERDTESVC